MKVLVTGGSGQLGRELAGCVPAGVTLTLPSRRELDVGVEESVADAVATVRPDVIINAAAYTAVDKAEAEPDIAQRVNADGAGHLARAAAAHGARVIHVSTDYVFGGAGTRPHGPGDPVAPQGAYARSKAEGERRVLAATGGAGVIVRTAWLYSRYGNNFVQTMIRLLRTRERLTVVNDQVGTPTWARSLARVLWRIVERPVVAGVQHWTDAGRCTWYEFALAIRDEGAALGVLEPRCAIVPVTTAEYYRAAGRVAPRPAFSVLDTTATEQATGLTPQPWRECLQHMLAELKAGPGQGNRER